jgi:K+-sensing histidine kinase KdpD
VKNITKDIKSLKTIEDAYESLGEYLHNILPNSIIGLIQLDDKRDLGYVNNIIGIRRKIFNRLTAILGINPIRKSFKNTSYCRRNLYVTDGFIQFDGNLHQLSGGIAPEWIFKAAEKLTHIKNIYVCGLSTNERVIGTVVVCPRGNDLANLKKCEEALHLYAIRMSEIIDQYNSKMVGIDPKKRFTKSLIENISHEIRTPLNGVLGLMDVGLKILSDNDNTKQLSNDIWQNSRDLTYKIDYLILISELESNTAKFNFNIIDTSTIYYLIANIVEEIKRDYPGREISIMKDIDEQLCWYKVDTHYFEVTIKELLRNALKFSDKEVIIRINTVSSLDIEVIDYGEQSISIPALGETQLFEKVNKSATYQSGMGIGYKIVNHIVSQHKWKIVHQANDDIGTNVKLSIPAESIN